MNRLITSATTLTNGQPITDKTIPFIEDGIQEAISNSLIGVMNGYTAGDIIILSGLAFTLSGGGNTLTWTSGSIFFNGEIYTIIAGAVTKTTVQTFLFTNTIDYTNGIDPIVFEDNTPHNVHQVRRAQLVAGSIGGGGTSNYISDYGTANVRKLLDIVTSNIFANKFDRQVDLNQSLGTNMPSSAPGPSTISTLTAAAGSNRDYKLEFTCSFNQVTTTPEVYVGFYKNGTLLFESHITSIPANGASQTMTTHFLDINAAAGSIYTVKARVSGSSNQYNLQSYLFSIDGVAH
jgi:hypothetical protein